MYKIENNVHCVFLSINDNDIFMEIFKKLQEQLCNKIKI